MYLHIQIENFRLFAALRASRKRLRGPLVLVDDEGRVAELNSAAQAKQVLPGMTMARAMSRCGEIDVVHVNASAEAEAERILWNASWQITPQIELGSGRVLGSATLELVRPDAVQLSGQVDVLIQRLRRCGLPARAGAAATPDWAELAATAAERFQFKFLPSGQRMRELLAHLPLQVLDCLNADACRILEGWGIRSLAAMARLPRQSLGERLGSLGLEAWDRINGRRHRVLRFEALAPDFREVIELEDPVDGMEALSFLIHQGAEALELQLEQAGKMARTVYLDLWIERGEPYHKSIRLPEATQQGVLLERLLRHHLEQVRLAGPVNKLQLAVDPVDPLSRQAGLFERSVRNPWRLQETLDQLAGLVGTESFGSPRLLDTHRPDAYRLDPLPTDADGADLAKPATGSGPPRMGPPLRRFRPPVPATVLLEQKRPVHLECKLVRGPVRAYHGPYRLNGDWAEADAWSIWEWDIEIEDAGVFCLSREAQRWQLVGAYD
jgi:protein ImuB